MIEVSPFHIEEVMSEEESFRRPDGQCDTEVLFKGQRTRCLNPAAIIIKVESNNGFAINCLKHGAEYLIQTGLEDCSMIRYSAEKVEELLVIAEERGWHNEKVKPVTET